MIKFEPYLTPKDILLNGAFGGSYFGRRENLQGDFKKHYLMFLPDIIAR